MFETLVLGSYQQFAFRSDSIKIGEDSGIGDRTESELNSLTGLIPVEFASLIRLFLLDISHNKLSDDLCPLSTLQNLVALNISYNNLFGQVPSNSFFSIFERSLL